jgi:hypothetical protein
MQICCGSAEKPTIFEEIKDNYPECATEIMEGKT